MLDVLHQLIDRVRWAREEEQVLAHQAIEDYRASIESTGAHATPSDSKPAKLSVADVKGNSE